MTTPHTGSAPSGRWRVVVLVAGRRVSRRGVTMIDELSRDDQRVARVMVVGVVDADSVARRLARAACERLLDTLARQGSGHVNITALAGPRVDVLECRRAALWTVVDEAKPDVVVDLARVGDVIGALKIAPGGVLQLWCDGAPEDIEFTSVLANPGKPRALILTARAADNPAPRVLWETVHPSTGSLGPDRNQLAARATVLILRALRGREQASAALPTNGAFTWESPARIASRAAVAGAGVVLRRLRRRGTPNAWSLLYRTRPDSFIRNGGRARSQDFRLMTAPSGGFFADPCAFSHQGGDFVFFELFTGRKGVIACSRLSGGELSAPEIVLETQHHLSYPFVFEHAGSVYMVPESSARRTVDLYRAVDFPGKWEFRRTLLDGVRAVDATLHHDGHRWWMFANVGELDSSTWDELFLYHADELDGPWIPHVGNPVKSDARSARPAGALFRRAGKLIRPSQDCSVAYGGGITFSEVETLNPSAYAEHVVDRLDPGVFAGCDGVHTVSSTDRLEVLDARWRTGVVPATGGAAS